MVVIGYQHHLFSAKRVPLPCISSDCPRRQTHGTRFNRSSSDTTRPDLSAQATAGPNGSERRVVVTGMGLVSCLGDEVDEVYNKLLAGTSGIAEITGFDASEFSTRFAGEVKHLDTTEWMTKKLERRLDNCIKYTLVAGKKAMKDAGLPYDGNLEGLDPFRCGILIGSAMGGMTSFAGGVEAIALKSYKKMNPFCVPFAITNMGSAMLAMHTGFMGPNYSIATACATGNYALLESANHIRRGDADIMLAGASDAAVIPSGVGGFIACKALSKRNDDPQAASRPWDRNRDGFVMGEGSGVLVLEELEHARARGAHIHAEVLGGAYTCDAYHMTDPRPDGAGVARCLRKALQAAGVGPEDVTYVNAHATSTQAGDLAEYKAIREVFGHDRLRVNATKSMIGHLLGAASAVEAIVSVQALRTGWLHPTLNLDDPEADVDMSVVVGAQKQDAQPRIALSNSFGFGGHNSAVLFAKFE